MDKQQAIALNQELEALGILFSATWFLPSAIYRAHTGDSCPPLLWSVVRNLSDTGAPVYLFSGEKITFSEEDESPDMFLLKLLERPGWLIVLSAEEPVCDDGKEVERDCPLHVFERVIYVDEFLQGLDMARQWASELEATARITPRNCTMTA